MAPLRQFCTFTANGSCFGVDVSDVQEVLRYQEMTRVPLAPSVVQGLINLRGQIVTAIDLRRRLGMPARAAGTLPMNVVLRTEEGAVSLLVDAIGDVVEVADHELESPPETLAGPARDLVLGVHQLEHHLLLILDRTKLIGLPAPLEVVKVG